MCFVASLLLHSATCDHWGTPRPPLPKRSARHVPGTWLKRGSRRLSVRSEERRRHAQLYPLLGMGSQRVFHGRCCMQCADRATRSAAVHPRQLPPPLLPTPLLPPATCSPPALPDEQTLQKVIAVRQARLPFRTPQIATCLHVVSSDPQPNCAPALVAGVATSKVVFYKERILLFFSRFLPSSPILFPRRRHTQWPLKGWTKRASSGVSSRQDVSPS